MTLVLSGAASGVRVAAPGVPDPRFVSPPNYGIMAGQRRGEHGFDPRDMRRRGRRGTLGQPAGQHEFYFTRAIYSGWGLGEEVMKVFRV